MVICDANLWLAAILTWGRSLHIITTNQNVDILKLNQYAPVNCLPRSVRLRQGDKGGYFMPLLSTQFSSHTTASDHFTGTVNSNHRKEHANFKCRNLLKTVTQQ